MHTLIFQTFIEYHELSKDELEEKKIQYTYLKKNKLSYF